ncbi:hypothetical protein AgCh_039668 [Apium graveolens]
MPRPMTETAKLKEGGIGLSYPMLARSHYTAWSIKMKVFMKAQGVWEAIEAKGKSTIAEKESSKEAWEAIKTMCQGADCLKQAKVQTLKSEFESLHMKDTETLDNFCLKINGLVANIRSLGEEMNESYVVKRLLRAMPSKFLQIVSTIEQFWNIETMSIEEAVGSLKAHEEHCKKPRREREQKQEINMAQIEDNEPALLLAEYKKEKGNLMLLNETMVPVVHTAKLSDRSMKVIHLGNEPGTKAYRLFDPDNRKILEGVEESSEEEQTGSGFSEGQTATSQSQNGTHDSDVESSSSSSSAPAKFRSLFDIYNDTEEVELDDELLLMGIDEPKNYTEAAKEYNWRHAMESEMNSIEKNNTWKLTELPFDRKVIGLKWIYKLKRDASGNIVKYKARLVAKGYVQKQGVDFDELFFPVRRVETVRLLLALAAKNNWEVHHLDVKTAFLNGEIYEEVYIAQPEGFVKKGEEHLFYKLIKALYGLRQAPRAWYSKLNKSLEELGFSRCPHEYAVYMKREKAICFHCNKLGHWKRNCKVYLAELKKKKGSKTTASDSGMFMIEVNVSLGQTSTWVLDTACGFYTCNSLQGLKGSRTLEKDEVILRMGNGARVAAISIGSFSLHMPTGKTIILNNCYYVPSIVRNIVFIPMLDLDAFSFIIKNNECSILRDNVLYGCGIINNGLLGHISENRHRTLHKEGFLDPFDFESYPTCESCLLGKMTKSSFSGH